MCPQPFGSMSVFVSPAADKQAVLAASKLALLDAGIEQSCVQVRGAAACVGYILQTRSMALVDSHVR